MVVADGSAAVGAVVDMAADRTDLAAGKGPEGN